jgi:hypothetical protein
MGQITGSAEDDDAAGRRDFFQEAQLFLGDEARNGGGGCHCEEPCDEAISMLNDEIASLRSQ